MIDWTRRTRASTSEGITETESLVSDLERGRSISEIVNAVATEAQQGFSESFGTGASFGTGTASGGAGSADLSSVAGLPLKVAGGSGESMGFGAGASYGRSSAWTTGQRNLSANMAQNILDRTHQASNSARNRWATVVREVSQSESERVSTRSITNYNHMHALSIEYFEVVQLCRVAVELAKATACLFIPMKLLDFEKMEIVSRYKRVIAAVGLIPRVRLLAQSEPDTITVSSPDRVGDWPQGGITLVQAMFGEPVGEPESSSLAFPLNYFPMFLSWSEDAPFDELILEYSSGQQGTLPISTTVNPQFGKYSVVFGQFGQTIDKATPFWDVVSIRLKKRTGSETWTGDVNFRFMMGSLQRDGFPKPQNGLNASTLQLKVNVAAADKEGIVLEMVRTVSGRELRQHLMDNRLYYSQAIWRSLDGATIAQLLSGYTFQGKSVLLSVDPLPVTIAGNFLVFRRHLQRGNEQAWEAWLKERDIIRGNVSEDLVPLPSGGVFAEAVLGRFNSAEKLDITRFWNWQDSPIPITAPDIAAIQMGSRAQAENLMPGQLSQPTLNIQISARCARSARLGRDPAGDPERQHVPRHERVERDDRFCADRARPRLRCRARCGVAGRREHEDGRRYLQIGVRRARQHHAGRTRGCGQDRGARQQRKERIGDRRADQSRSGHGPPRHPITAGYRSRHLHKSGRRFARNEHSGRNKQRGHGVQFRRRHGLRRTSWRWLDPERIDRRRHLHGTDGERRLQPSGWRSERRARFGERGQ